MEIMTMATRKLSILLAAIAVVLASVLVDHLSAAQSGAQDVRTVIAGFATTWNRHDMNAFGKLFAPDAEFVNVAGDLRTGRQSIQAQHAYIHGAIPADSSGFSADDRRYYGIFKNSTPKLERIDVRLLRNGTAIAHVNWELLGDERTHDPRRGVFLFVLTRQDATWQIAAAQNTEIHRTVN